MSDLSYQFIPDPAETVRATAHIQRRQIPSWLSWVIWPTLALVAAARLAAGAHLANLWMLGLTAGVIGGLQLLTPWVQRRTVRRLYAETPGLTEPQVYTFTDAALTIRSGATTITLGWPSIVEIDETAESFLLFYSRRFAYYIPKRAVGGKQAQEELRELLRERLGTRAARLGDA